MVDSFSDARNILESRNKRVIPLLMDLSIQTHNQLAQLPSEGDIVLICSKTRRNYNLWLVSLYCHPARMLYLSGITSDEDRQILKQSAAVIYDEGIPHDQIQELIDGRPEVKLQFVINVQSIENIRNLLLYSQVATSDN